jgi:hypothetical protein
MCLSSRVCSRRRASAAQDARPGVDICRPSEPPSYDAHAESVRPDPPNGAALQHSPKVILDKTHLPVATWRILTSPKTE